MLYFLHGDDAILDWRFKMTTTARRTFTVATIFAEQYPSEWSWILANPKFAFAVSLRSAIERWGSLTENQLAALRRCMESGKRREQERAEREKATPVIDVDASSLTAAFDKAKANGLKYPKMRFEGFSVSPAPMNGVNAGAIYVKNGETYLGKIISGRFMTTRECTPEIEANVIRVMQSPSSEAIAYGIKTGNCSICGATLTNGDSIKRGIGPICAGKFGF